MHQIDPPLQQLGIRFKVTEIGLRTLSTSDIVIGITQPIHSIFHTTYRPLHNLRIQLIHNLTSELTFDRQLLIQQR
jgi:hypothetical protein